jgi:glycosyltransferase involved in cell wall biosynthesis
MPKNVSILALDQTDWHSPWMNRQQILSRLGTRGWNVVYACGRFATWQRHTQAYKNAPFLPGFERCDNVTIDRGSKLLVAAPRLKGLDALTLRWHAMHLRSKALEQGGKLAVIIYNPAFLPYADLIKPDYLVFYLRDAYHAEPGWKEADQRRFDDLARRADLIVASQAQMAAPIAEDQKKDLLELPNGVDFEAFSAGGPEPGDLAAIPGPRIGYVGRINSKVDLGLLLHLARQRQDWKLVLVGPLVWLGSEEKEQQWKALVALPNVHWLGGKPLSELPAYTAAMDVHLLSYDMVAAPWTTYGSPLKLYECLAAGRPVVSAPLQTMKPMDGVIRVASSPAEWESAIEQALAQEGPDLVARRQAIAAQNSWDVRVDALEARLAAMAGPVVGPGLNNNR